MNHLFIFLTPSARAELRRRLRRAACRDRALGAELRRLEEAGQLQHLAIRRADGQPQGIFS